MKECRSKGAGKAYVLEAHGTDEADEGDEPWSWDTEPWHQVAPHTYDDYYDEDEDNTADEHWPAMCLIATACPPLDRPMPEPAIE